MNLKQNINRIHNDLSNNFGEVVVSEKSNIEFGNYIELSILEGNKNLKIIITKTSLENDKFNWKYYANPLNEGSDLVDRNSSIGLFIEDIKDIFEKNRFNSEYILIKENNQLITTGDSVKMSDGYKEEMSKDDENREHIEEFGDSTGVVLGQSEGDWPEVDVRWQPSGLKYSYDPKRDLIKIK